MKWFVWARRCRYSVYGRYVVGRWHRVGAARDEPSARAVADAWSGIKASKVVLPDGETPVMAKR